MRELTERALNTAQVRGARYADVRIIHHRSQSITVKNGVVEALGEHESLGFGVRVIADGAWGFAASSALTPEEIDRVAAQAVAIARASASVSRAPVDIGPPVAERGRYVTPVRRDPFAVSADEKIAYLLRADEAARSVPGVAVVDSGTEAWRDEKIFASTEGAYIEQIITESGVGMEVTAVSADDMQTRSYPNSFGRHWETGGYEVVERWDLPHHAARLASEAVALLSAEQCPSGVTTLILDGSQTALQIHESCGHPIELDRVMGMEAAYAGTSFLTTDKLGTFQYGSPLVNMTADATLPGGLGSFGYDDEGVPAQRTTIVRDGIFVGYLMDRQTATTLGMRSNGTSRAEGWGRIPMIRMTNINIEPGTWTLDNLIADTDDGIYMAVNRSWSIDDRRLNFQFGCEIAWEIKNGKLGRMLKNPTYTGITPQFWASCDAICDRDHWLIWGTPNCGKGQPSQIGHVGHGASPARFRQVRVGVLS